MSKSNGHTAQKFGFRYFSNEEYAELNQLIMRMREGDQAAENKFVNKIEEWCEYKVNEAKRGIFKHSKIRADIMADILTDCLVASIRYLKQRPAEANNLNRVWSDFNTFFSTELREKLSNLYNSNGAQPTQQISRRLERALEAPASVPEIEIKEEADKYNALVKEVLTTADEENTRNRISAFFEHVVEGTDLQQIAISQGKSRQAVQTTFQTSLEKVRKALGGEDGGMSK